MKTEIVLTLIFACVMLVLDRVLRIQPLLAGGSVPKACPSGSRLEPFAAPVTTLNIPCGVDFPSCPAGSTCGNGWCVATTLNPLRENCPLPVLP